MWEFACGFPQTSARFVGIVFVEGEDQVLRKGNRKETRDRTRGKPTTVQPVASLQDIRGRWTVKLIAIRALRDSGAWFLSSHPYESVI